MYEVTPEDQEALRAQLAQSRERLEGLSCELQSIDAELEDLSSDAQRYQLLHEICGGLEKLGELGATGLFWGDQIGEHEAANHVGRVRRDVDEFQQQLHALESSRQAIVDRMQSEEQSSDQLEDGVLEAQWLEEQKKLEWVPERELGPLPMRETIMAWARGGEDDQRFRKSLAAGLAIGLLIGLLLPMIDLPLPERGEEMEVPERLARLIQQERALPPPPIERTRPEETKPEPIEDAPLLAEEGTPQPANDQPPKKSPASKGILAFREKFSGLAEADPAARLGAQARISSSAKEASGRPQRSMVTTQAPGSSGGINIGSLSRDIGGGGGPIEGVQVARATSSIGAAGGTDRPLSGGAGSARTDEEIQIVFDRHKSALYRLYNRELRKNPTLQGQMVLRLTIQPDGSVSFCALQSSDMKAPELSAQVVERVGTFDFGAKDGIPAITILYPIDFLPAT